jgi:hypothetical protein
MDTSCSHCAVVSGADLGLPGSLIASGLTTMRGSAADAGADAMEGAGAAKAADATAAAASAVTQAAIVPRAFGIRAR